MWAFKIPFSKFGFFIMKREYCTSDKFGMNGVGDLIVPLKKITLILWSEEV